MEQIPHILSGIAPRNELREKLKTIVSQLTQPLTLVIIQVGSRPDSQVYIKQKILFGESIGVLVRLVQLPETVSEDELQKEIEKYNIDSTTSGIIVQLPLPQHIKPTVVDHIDSKKDVDCLGVFHREQLEKGDIQSASVTARAICYLLDYYTIPISDKKVVVVGRSALVGHTTAVLMRLRGAHVTVLHRKSEDKEKTAREADILVVAAGAPRLVTAEWINSLNPPVVVDVGIHKTDRGLVGDVDRDSVLPFVSALSPVPGGVGPLTVACLFQHLIELSTSSAL
jgi:methylenetetrahydrofolate dehydrogenase (NADP+)/methenyltetrahydrofolate cyclohydrolase